MTTYRLASSPADYRKCRALMRDSGEAWPLTFPTHQDDDGAWYRRALRVA